MHRVSGSFHRYKANEQMAMRDGDWKYLKIAGQEYLFNLAQDARERANLKDKHPDVFARLRNDYATWNGTMLPYPPDSPSESAKDFYPDRY